MHTDLFVRNTHNGPGQLINANAASSTNIKYGRRDRYIIHRCEQVLHHVLDINKIPDLVTVSIDTK